MKKILIIIFNCLASFAIYAQTSEIPHTYRMVDPEEYTKYEPQVKAAIEWYLNKSSGRDADKRSDATVFFSKWVEGNHSGVNVILQADIITFAETSPSLVAPFMMGWCLYSMNNNYSTDLLQCNKAGIEAMVRFYQNNKTYQPRDKNVDKYEKMVEKQQLEKYLKKKLKSALKDQDKKKDKKKKGFDPNAI